MLPDSVPSAQRGRQHPRRAVLTGVAALALLAGLGTLLWHARTPSPVPFVYLHGRLPAPGAGGDAVVFQLKGARGTRRFTLAQLRALPAVQYRATQPQLKRSFVYTGVPLHDLAQLAGLSGRKLRVVADDQFGATISPAEYQPYPVMIAYLADGRPITAAQKGPLEVVFPNEQYQKQFHGNGSEWVWFATDLTVLP